MNKPPIKPAIPPKSQQLIKKNSKSFEIGHQTVKPDSSSLESDLKPNYSNGLKLKPDQLDKSKNESGYLKLDDLHKALNLLNQSSLPEKESENHYDIRVDEDQIETCNRIIKTLSEAGYLRANIIGLSEFDKIIGGVCWCIELCNIDIDIDLFYQTTLTIGQKLALTEKIFKVLTIMKCPHQIEAHQIQGLDCINILTVVQWLIKESREFSMHIKDYNDMFAAWKFDCDHGLQGKEDLLVISRSKEVKKIIKEYFNKNEIKINLEYKLNQYETELESVQKMELQLDEEGKKLDSMIGSKEEEIERIENECIVLNERLIEHQSAEKKQLAMDYSRLVDELKQIKSTNKSSKSKMKREHESLLSSTTVELDRSDLLNQLEFERGKLHKIKTQLADRNKSYLMIRRKHDNILSEAEISQYQKRFLELSVQVACKHDETKKFYILYNQLENTKKQLENKFLFFESLLKCYGQLDPASKNDTLNQQFSLQLEQKINSLNSILLTIQSKNQAKLKRKKSLEQQNVELIEMSDKSLDSISNM